MSAHEFAQLIEKYLDHFTVMLAITTEPSPTAEDIVTNATGSLVHTGQKELLITNEHFYAKFLSYRENAPDAKMVMSGAHGTRFLDISEAEVMGLDKAVDLAVLHLPSQWVLRQGKMWSIPESWPPPRPDVGMMGVLYGYPGQGRMPENGVLGASPISIGLPVVSVGDRHFVLLDENQDVQLFVPEGQRTLTSFGGISGSAVYAIPRNFTPTGSDSGLCGFAYEASDSGVILVSHADHINADGSVR